MGARHEELSELKSFIGTVDTSLTMILQHLQWDRNKLLKCPAMVGCKYDINHRIPECEKETHEQTCLLTYHKYSKEDIMLPEAPAIGDNNLVKFDKTDITQIINRMASADPSFKKESDDLEPLTLSRLQETYTPDERRAIYDAVVAAAPSCHDLSDLALPSTEASTSTKQKSRVEILAELRDMKRRRTKYRVAAKTRNYSDVLRDVIKTQMEVYSDVKVAETTVVNTSSKHKIVSKVEDTHSSKHSRKMSSRFEVESNNRRHQEHRGDRSKDRSRHMDVNNSAKSKQYNLIKYPDPREYKPNRYDEDRHNTHKNPTLNSHTSKTHEYEKKSKYDQRDYARIKIKEETCDDGERYRNKRGFDDSEGNYERNHRDYNKRRHTGERERKRFDEKYHRSDGRSKDHKRDKRQDGSRERAKYERSYEDRYRKERYIPSNSNIVSKKEINHEYDS